MENNNNNRYNLGPDPHFFSDKRMLIKYLKENLSENTRKFTKKCINFWYQNQIIYFSGNIKLIGTLQNNDRKSTTKGKMKRSKLFKNEA